MENNDILTIFQIVDIIENNFSEDEQKQISEILFRVEHSIDNSLVLSKLVDMHILRISTAPYTEYRLRKYFEKHNIQKISEKKDIIIPLLPSLKGLKRGKSASYDDLIYFIDKNYSDIIINFTSEIKIYEFTEQYKENGRDATLYFYRKFNPKSRYERSDIPGRYVLKHDKINNLLKERNINIEVENPSELFVYTVKTDLTDSTIKTLKECEEELISRKIKDNIKLALLVFFWPIGLCILIKKLFIKK